MQFIFLIALISIEMSLGCVRYPKEVETNPAVKAQQFPAGSFDGKVKEYAEELLEQGCKIFRFDTFGSEAFWGDKLRLHEAIAGKDLGGIGSRPDAQGRAGPRSESRCRRRSPHPHGSAQSRLGESGEAGNHAGPPAGQCCGGHHGRV